MKKIVFFLFIVSCFSCVPRVSRESQSTVDSTAYYRAKCDTLTYMVTTYEKYLVSYENQLRDKRDSIQVLTDSVVTLNDRPLMTKAQFLELYRYERLLKYYQICKNKPTQWKYYKGWSTRVFEQTP